MQKHDIGIIGLSVMGKSLALNMADHGFAVAGYNRSRSVTENMAAKDPHENFTPVYTLEELASTLVRPRKIMLMIKAGASVDAVLKTLTPLLEPGDIVLDGGNSFFEDTARRSSELQEKGLYYFGVGISGGEEGARNGPSIMPGGDKSAYAHIAPILNSIAAKAGGEPCCAYIGPGGAGHYVKMVHNGIEYADMQLIAEAYLLLKHVAGMGNKQLADVFCEWNEGELNSYLIEITANILREADDFGPGELVDHIVDSAAQKGTGRWASIESLKQGVDISMITSACNARVMSNRVRERREAARAIRGASAPAIEQSLVPAFAQSVRDGLYAAKIVAYAQGFALMRDASNRYGWALDLGEIASIFRAGCIIKAAFLSDITRAYRENPALKSLMLDGFFLSRINANLQSLTDIAVTGLKAGLALPASLNALAYVNAFRGEHLGANLIQAQRDCFGAHTYERTDREGTFHHEWGKNK